MGCGWIHAVQWTHSWTPPGFHSCRDELAAQNLIVPRRGSAFSPAFLQSMETKQRWSQVWRGKGSFPGRIFFSRKTEGKEDKSHSPPFSLIIPFSHSKSSLITSYYDKVSHWNYSGLTFGSWEHGLAHRSYDVGKEYLTHLKLSSLHSSWGESFSQMFIY